ncbi:glycoside hydrolase family 44 protein [Emticicia sp. CRIBPO]|uniref:glycoside hydrolase family 44 protein n=1 Tax=Emticicia sp. CRIBPO TaxID=2683258 RepID=UPI001E320F49|nr:glycoside hydrolase family 44 protein [Emticicia sp. CRIBPO]
MMKRSIILGTILLFTGVLNAQVTISIDVLSEKTKVSPYIYGRNNSLSSTNPTETISQQDILRIKDAGVTFFRESGGNNSTKYNWRRKLSSHPDWYNNVYTNDWDKAAKAVQDNFPNAQGMWSFQLIGKAAKTNQYNFNDWGYNQSQWWDGVNQNLAGNGVLNTTGTKAKTEGNPDLYLENWPADSTVGILNHWFGSGGLGLDKSKIRYWSMDNEAEIWGGTHDDVMPVMIEAEAFMQKYFEVAKKARKIYPDIKLLGPVTANEWQWYHWNNKLVESEGKKYTWLEYFIKRIAEEQKATGIRLLDVLDVHFYPGEKAPEDIVQLHRVFFDKNYVYPGANGVKNISGNWDNTQNKEYIFGRVNEWLLKYLGEGHGVTLALTESGIETEESNVAAVWYASVLGEFMRNKVEIFTPWSWKKGMWEVMHLFTKYNHDQLLKATSTDETLVSAYPTINKTGDSVSVVLINRSPTLAKTVSIKHNDFVLSGTSVRVFTINALPASESFVSDKSNALKSTTATINNNSVSLSLPAMSVSTVLLTGKTGKPEVVTALEESSADKIEVFPNPSDDYFTIRFHDKGFESLKIFDLNGKEVYADKINQARDEVQIRTRSLRGKYILLLEGKGKLSKKQILINP